MKIYHYLETDGEREYIILTEDPDFSIEDNERPGYEHYKTYEFEGNTDSLPLDRELNPRS